MRLDELKIGDKFKYFCQMTGNERNTCVYVGLKTVPYSKISDSKKVHCFIDYRNNHSMYANGSLEVEKVDNFEVIEKQKWDISFACSPYVALFNITKFDLNYIGTITTVYIAHSSPDQMENYISNNPEAFHIDFEDIAEAERLKIIWK